MSEVKYIPLEKLVISRFNVRIEVGDLSELVESIKRNGIEEPLIVRPISDKYEVIAGRRRYEAAKLAGLKEAPCIVRDISDEEALIISTVENIQRKNISEREIAEAYLKLKDLNPEWTVEKFAEQLGKSENWLKDILVAYEVAKPAIEEGVIKDFKSKPSPEEKDVLPVSHLKEIGYALNSLPKEEKREKAVKLVNLTKEMPVDMVKEITEKVKSEPEKPLETILPEVFDERWRRAKEEILKEREKKIKPKKPGTMKILDPEHSIVDYIDYFIELLKRFRGDEGSIEKITVKPNNIVIEYHGYDKYIPRDLSLTIRHGVRSDGKDMVSANIREDLRDIFYIIKEDLDGEEPRYSLIPKSHEEEKPREESEKEKAIYQVKRPKTVKKRKIWRLKDEARAKALDIFYRLDKDGRRIWSLLNQNPYGVSEDEIMVELRSAGYSKEDAYNIMIEKREDFLLEDWIEIEE